MSNIVHDTKMQAAFREIIRQANVSCIIETGTNDGSSTIAFSQLVEHVYTVEIDGTLFNVANSRFSEIDNIGNWLGDSAAWLGEHLQAFIETARPGSALIVLDAHWREEWPLLNELAAINLYRQRTGMQVTVIIDDWFISGHPQFSGCYGGLRGDDSRGRESALMPCCYESFCAELKTFTGWHEPIYRDGGIGYAIFTDFSINLGQHFRKNR